MNGVSKVTWTFMVKKFIKLSIFISEENVVVFCKVSLQYIDSQAVVSTSEPYNKKLRCLMILHYCAHETVCSK